MKILIINHRYFVSGGPERYLFNLKELLEQNKHVVIPFSVRYTQNEKSEYEKYFVPPVSNENEVYFKDQTWNPKSFFKTIERLFYSREVYQYLSTLLKDEKPDFAIVLHYSRKLSPSVVEALKDYNIPFVVRVSDFGMVCPNNMLIRENKICEKCISGNLWNSVRYKCVKNSYGASLIQYLAAQFHYLKGYYETIPLFLVPSKFTMEKLIQAGWDENKLIHFPTFVKDEIFLNGNEKKGKIVYIGRLDEEKGVLFFLHTIKLLQDKERNNEEIQYVIVGSGTPEFEKSLKEYSESNNLKNVLFLGKLSKPEIDKLIQESLLMVAPSLWYDNMPNSVLEALSMGLPVIASNHGSFPEIIEHYKTGLLFKAGDKKDFADKITLLLKDETLRNEISTNAKQFIEKKHSPKKHYETLMNICNKYFNLQ